MATLTLPQTIVELLEGFRRRSFTALEVAEHLSEQVTARAELGALRWFDPDRLLAAARQATEQWQRGGARPLTGIPLAVKDNIDTAGVPTTSGSAVHLGRVPTQDAVVWARLQQAGAMLLGKAHLSEFAYAGVHPDFGVVRNPCDPERSPGSSSSGSAAAVAGGLAPGALGTDTGGSIRVPAAYCGIVGLKPTNERVELSGVTPLAWSLDSLGPLAWTVTDAALLLEHMLPEPLGLIDPDSLTLRASGPHSLRVGVLENPFVDPVQPEVAVGLQRAAQALRAAGCRVNPVELPDLQATHAAHRTILLSEAFSYHAAGLERDAPYGPAFRAAVSVGRSIPAHMYINSLRWRQLISAQLAELFADWHLMLSPTCRTTAPKLEGASNPGGAATQLTYLANFAGLPAITLPTGHDEAGLPTAVHLMARPYAEAQLLQGAFLLERELGLSHGCGA